MKKFIVFAMLTLTPFFATQVVDAKEMNFFGCTTKNYVKTCKYGIPESDVGKTIKYHYTKSMIIKKKEIMYFGPFMNHKTIYNYNKKGQLKSNKYGNASRYIYKYDYDFYNDKLAIVYREIKKYDSKQNASFREFRYSNNTKGYVTTRDKRYYKNNKITQKKFYKYNKKGQLKSNKYGKASRKVIKYKLNKKKKSYAYYNKTRYYNAKGKLV